MLKIFRYFVQMSSLSKTYSYAFILLATIFCSLFASGQTITKNKSRKKHPTTIGFQTGKDVILSPTYNKPIKVNFGVNNNLFLRKKLKPHFQLKSGLNYDRSQNPIYKYSSADPRSNNSMQQFGGVSIPATLQYYFLPEKSKLHPYCGAGFQYNLNISPKTISPFPTETYPSSGTTASQSPGTKYITILFTQGITYEINTKIQVTQSIHFIPNTTKTFGIDLGIGYTIP